MNQYNRLFDLVQEMNQKWAKLDRDIESGKRRQDRAQTIATTRLIDRDTFIDYGSVSVDANGFVRSLQLNPDEVVRASDDHVLMLICDAINSDNSMPSPQIDLTEYEVTP